MFCFQCQEALKNEGCVKNGVCGKKENTAELQDALVYVLKGISLLEEKALAAGKVDAKVGQFITQALFATVTNTNFDDAKLVGLIEEGLALKKVLLAEYGVAFGPAVPEVISWSAADEEAFVAKAKEAGVLATENVDVRSLRELLIYGVKGIAAYAHHAGVLGYEDPKIYHFMVEALAATTKDLSAGDLTALVLKAGETAVTTMALLDQANTTCYGHPELTQVNIGVRSNPAILISGHDLKDMEELLKQTEGTGVDVYTHSEMLPANYYPAFKKYGHFVGNYGNSWWHQNVEFDSFNGAILMTTNCIVPPKDSYKDRMFTTGMAGYPGVKHIADRNDGQAKDFSSVIETAKACPSPKEIETGTIVGGFARQQVLALADKVVAAVKSGAIKRFVVMAGCDGRQKDRSYFTDVAEALPQDAVILTAGCAKYRYNKLNLGDIGGIPRVLDAGQCNDCYSLAVIALTLKDVFGLKDINDLPLSFDIAWYEQKAVAVLLALLFLGVKGIRLGPTLPAFVSPNVAKVLVDNFGIKVVGDVKGDVEAMMAGA